MITLNRAESVMVHAFDDRSTRVYFPENLRLRGLKINYLWLIDSAGFDRFSTAGTGPDHGIASQTDFNHFLVLVSSENEIVSKLPLYTLFQMGQCGEPYFVNEKVDFSKCYIERVGNKSICDFCFVFGVWDKSQDYEYNRDLFEIRYRFENSEIKFTPQQAAAPIRRLYFDDTESFSNRLLNRLYLYDGAGKLSPNGNEIVADSVVNNTLITLKDVFGNDIFYNIPLKMLTHSFCNCGLAFAFDNCRIDWKKSYIDDYSTPDTDFVGYRSFYFGLELSK